MSADDSIFLDVLSHVPNDIKRYSNDVADYVDKHIEKVSNTLREALSHSEWIPEAARPRAPPPPPRTFTETIIAPTSYYGQVSNWVARNKILTTVIILAIGGTTYYAVRRKTNRKKRRAKKASNGMRLEVVVIAGNPSEPLTRSVALDMERRGFIVYVVCNTIEEEVAVRDESRADIKPLSIDITDSQHARESVERFTTYLQTPHAPMAGARPHHLSFRSLVLIPSSTFPNLPIATLPASALSDLLNTRLLTPILTAQVFLPLLTSLPLSNPSHPHPPKPEDKPTVVVLTPTIISSLKPAFHLPESLVVSGLETAVTVLRAELAPLGIPVSHLRLGTFDFSAFTNRQALTLNPSVAAQRAETLTWEPADRQAYGKNFVATTSGKSIIGRGSSLRGLNNAVFDAMVSTHSQTVSVGIGSSVYRFVGNWVPSGLVGWMMGVRHVSHDIPLSYRAVQENLSASRETSPESSTSGGGVFTPAGLGESEFEKLEGLDEAPWGRE